MLAASILKPPSVVAMIAPGSAGGQGRACEWSRCLVRQTSYESELLQVAHAVMDSSKTTQINVFITRVPVPAARPSWYGDSIPGRAAAILNVDRPRHVVNPVRSTRPWDRRGPRLF